MREWSFYILKNNNCTYAGVSPDPIRRLRQHNKEIKGGAKYTTNKAPGWTHICIIRGFRTKIESMQFEWGGKTCATKRTWWYTWSYSKIIPRVLSGEMDSKGT